VAPRARNSARRKGWRGAFVYSAMAERSINITFHGVAEPPRPLDPGEEDVWVGLEKFLAVLDGVAERTDVGISFDDGNLSDVEQALPALRERGLRATFFIVAGRLGAPHFVDEDNVRSLLAAGMEIGCHGMRHRPWRGLDGVELHEELVEAKAILEGVTGRPVTRAACPFGSYDRRVLRTLRRSGYYHVYTSDRGMARSGSFLQARNSVGPRDGSDVLAGIAELEAPAHRALGHRSKLIVKRWR
jgi:Polysaccharide deacetylase